MQKEEKGIYPKEFEEALRYFLPDHITASDISDILEGMQRDEHNKLFSEALFAMKVRDMFLEMKRLAEEEEIANQQEINRILDEWEKTREKIRKAFL